MFKRNKNNNDHTIWLLRARVKELENLLCPGEAHDWGTVSLSFDVIDSYGTVRTTYRQVCKRCFAVHESDNIH